MTPLHCTEQQCQYLHVYTTTVCLTNKYVPSSVHWYCKDHAYYTVLTNLCLLWSLRSSEQSQYASPTPKHAPKCTHSHMHLPCTGILYTVHVHIQYVDSHKGVFLHNKRNLAQRVPCVNSYSHASVTAGGKDIYLID